MVTKQRARVASHPERESGTLSLTFRIYVFPEDDGWRAETTAPPLMAIGETQREALDALKALLMDYLRTVLDHGWDEQIHRPASLRRRMEVQIRVALAKLRHKPASVRLQQVTV